MKFANVILIGLAFIAQSVSAYWDGVITGKVKQIHVTGANNYGFRVTLEGYPKLCGNEHNWAYVNGSDSNYSVYVSVLTAAKAAGQEVRLHTTRKDGIVDGYCHLGYLIVL